MKGKLLLLLLILLFLIRFLLQHQLNLTDGQTIRVSGTLNQEPTLTDKSQVFSLGQIKIITKRLPEHHYGDQIQAVGKIKVDTIFLVPYVRYGIRDNVLIYPEIKSSIPTRPGLGGTIMVGIIGLRNRLSNFYQQSLPSPLDGIVAGVVLGDKSLLPAHFWERLRQTGTLHIMVASGMNIAFFAETVLAGFCFLFKRRYAVILLYLTIWFYTILTGATPPVVRAAIMASLVYLGQLVGRTIDSKRILWLTGAVMLFIQPAVLFDIGFQLSFLATLGLIYCQPLVEKWQKYCVIFKFKSFSSSIAAQITTLPVLINSFGTINIISPITNLSVLWLIPYILLGGSLFGIIGLITPTLGKILGLLLFPITFYLEQIINLFAKLTIFQVQIPKFLIVLWPIYYGVVWWRVKKGKTNLSN